MTAKSPIPFRPIPFEGKTGRYHYRVHEKRAPKRGEYYLSGAIAAAYLAPNDYRETDAYWIVTPLERAEIASNKGETDV